MQAPMPSASGSGAARAPDPAPNAPPAPTEIVRRPDPGLARGKWEAPMWLFWALLAAVVVGATLYLLRRMGVLRLKKSPKKA